MWSLLEDGELLCVIRAFVRFNQTKALLYVEFLEFCDYFLFTLHKTIVACFTISDRYPEMILGLTQGLLDVIPEMETLNACSAVTLLRAIKRRLQVTLFEDTL
jgi:hypothetical protein